MHFTIPLLYERIVMSIYKVVGSKGNRIILTALIKVYVNKYIKLTTHFFLWGMGENNNFCAHRICKLDCKVPDIHMSSISKEWT